MHVPLNKEAVRDAMPVLMELLEEESEASVRAVLGHFIFVFIHLYMDGNGRMGRFIMNLMLASRGYPWTIIPVEQRDVYMKSLEDASAHLNILPFVKFISHLVRESIKGKPVAKIQFFLILLKKAANPKSRHILISSLIVCKFSNQINCYGSCTY